MNVHVRRCSSLLALAFATGCASTPPPPPASAASSAAPAASSATPAASPASASLPPPNALVASDPATLSRACDQLLTTGRAHLAELVATPRPVPRAGNARVLELYDETEVAFAQADHIGEIAFNANPDPAVRAAAEKCSQAANAADTERLLDRRVYDLLVSLDLSGEDGATRYWIDVDLGDYRRAGVDRDEATRAKVKTLRDQIVELSQKFEQNINDDASKVELDPADLEGTPADWRAKHPVGSDGKVTVTTQYPDYFPFMTFASREAAREKLYRAFRNRAYPQNLEVLSQLLHKRHELATLLGYKSWAALAMEDQMIRTPAAAHDFIEQIAHASGKRADADYQQLLTRWRKVQPRAKEVPAWDVSWTSERVRAEQLDFDAQSVRPYFEFSRVEAGLLDLTGRLFGIEYKKVSDAKVWHPEVEVYDVFDATAGGRKLGRIYLDLHPRAGKFSHAAQFALVDGKEGVRLPEGVLLCNFARPGERMEHGDVRTFFHEFGHLLHHTFAGHTRWAATASLRERDFVEAPSQLLEEWTLNSETLQTFARHDQTNEPIPAAMVERMRAADAFGRGLGVRRQMVFAGVSLAYYDRDPDGLDTTKVYAEMEGRYSPVKHVDGTFEQAAFGHLTGYSSNYYTYMWSLVIAKDLFTPFQAAGLMDRATATRYRHAVLEAGGSKPAAEMVRAFLGRPFNFKAYTAWLDETVPAKKL